MKALIEACRWLDVMSNRKKAALLLSKPNYVNAPVQVIEARLMGSTDIGCDLGVQKYKDDYMLFYNNGIVNTPKLSYGIWFMAQYMRFGMLNTAPNYNEVAKKLIMSDLFEEVAKSMNVPVQEDMKPFKTTIETIVFDPKNPATYIAGSKK